ncbi:MAG: DUF87 domain-containing protein [Thaumarchaeota archaeon]|nr:DUF87 domain-containing protein [Nitrososphaerota archaeon]
MDEYSDMKVIGVIASDSSDTNARVILNEHEEVNVKAEDLVLVENRDSSMVMAVLRSGHGSNENLKPGGYHPGVAFARVGGKPSTAKETYDFALTVIGEVGSEVKQNKKIIAPGCEVRIFDDEHDPMRLLSGNGKTETMAHYEGHPNWKVPVQAKFIPYHIGIFASTGGGKSYLARHQVIPLLERTGYSVLILDWKGRDYAPYYPKSNVLSISELAFDPDTVARYLVKKMGNFGYYGSSGSVIQAVEEVILLDKWRGLSPDEFKQMLETSVIREVNPNKVTSGKPREEEQRFRRGLSRLKNEDIQNILGTKKPEDLVKDVQKKNVLVVDMKKTGRDEKLAMFLTLANYLMEQMQNDEDLDLAVVIDEAPQYCPFKPDGIQNQTTEVIIDMCALGRTHKLSMCMLSQGIAGEIGINAAVRRNLNTQFVGKIHPLDMNEAANWLAPYNIDPKFLLSLPPGHFYFMGSMNVSPIPLLITFQID